MNVLGLAISVITILAGALGAAGFILGKRPDAKPMFEKLAPFQGGIGIVGVVFALIGLLQILTNIGTLLKAALVGTVIALAGDAALLGTGFLLGFSLIANGMAKKPEAAQKAEELRAKLLKFQIPMGFVCIVLGVLGVLSSFR